MIAAGAFAPDLSGALFLFKNVEKEAVEDFVEQDPYFSAGLITSYDIKIWMVPIGHKNIGL